MKRVIAIICILMVCTAAACSPLLPLGCAALVLSAGIQAEQASQSDETTQQEQTAGTDRHAPILRCTAEELIISVYENQAIPFRFESEVSGALPCVELVKEETLQEPSFPFAAGDSPARHVFTYRWLMDGEGTVTLKNLRMEEYRDHPSNKTDYAEKYVYAISRYDGIATIDEVTE